MGNKRGQGTGKEIWEKPEISQRTPELFLLSLFLLAPVDNRHISSFMEDSLTGWGRVLRRGSFYKEGFMEYSSFDHSDHTAFEGGGSNRHKAPGLFF